VKRCPANAGQNLVFARHRNALTAQWLPAKREPRAGQSLYVPLPGFRCRLMGLPDARLKHSEIFRNLELRWNTMHLGTETFRNILGIF
jgi:hypothetical protein